MGSSFSAKIVENLREKQPYKTVDWSSRSKPNLKYLGSYKG